MILINTEKEGYKMSTTQPIKLVSEIRTLKDFYEETVPNDRNRLLIIMGLNTALRIGDILNLRYKDIYSFGTGKIKSHISVIESKTGKANRVYINEELKTAIRETIDITVHKADDWLFPSRKHGNKPLSRYQAYRITRNAAEASNLSLRVSPHSLRKTFGYHAWQHGASPVLLMNVYNHSSYNVTKRYLGIDQDEKDSIFKENCL